MQLLLAKIRMHLFSYHHMPCMQLDRGQIQGQVSQLILQQNPCPFTQATYATFLPCKFLQKKIVPKLTLLQKTLSKTPSHLMWNTGVHWHC